VLLQLAGPRLWPTAYYGALWPGYGMMGQGGMMGGYGMMGGEVQGDPAQPFDLRFLDQMILHHQGGVLMTEHMVQNSAHSELRDLAQRIITAQRREIDQMRAWRSQWYPDAPAAPAMPGMGGTMMNRGQMAQMMGGQEQLDRMFLQMMIPHHQDAISMARQAIEASEHPEVSGLAEAIISSQTAEIDEMRGYLRDFFGTTTP
jgi:uncharacterized protein (DUF305 family)